MVRASNETNHRPRPSLHVSLRKSANQTPGHPTEPIHSLSPPDRWIVRTKEPMGRTISPLGHLQSTQRLVHMASDCHCHPQQPEERHHRLIAQSNLVWI